MADTVLMTPDTNLSQNTIMLEGSGKAYQFVAQSTAIAIQDAVDNLRNINTIATTAIGVATAQMLANYENPNAIQNLTKVIVEAQAVAAGAVANFTAIGTGAAAVLKSYPVG